MRVISHSSGVSSWPVPRPLPPLQSAAPPAPARGTRRPAELRNTVALLVTILLISVMSLLYMNQAAALATSGYQIGQLQQQRAQLQRENDALQVELAQLNSLPAIQQAATDKLHMTKSDLSKVQYVTLDQKQLDLAQTP